MKRSYYLLPLMAMTALSLSLAACDDKKTEENQTSVENMTPAEIEAAKAAENAANTVMPAAMIGVQNATAYATAEGATNGAVFLTLNNPGEMADKLIGASASVASSVELHQNMVDENGVMQMTKVDAIDLPPAQQVTLTPDGYHIMLMGLNAPLAEGSSFDVTLDFENAADVTTSVNVVAPAPSDAAPMGHDGHDHGTTTDSVAPSMDESPADMTTPTDEPMPMETPTDEPVVDAPVDEQPAQ